jgi:hypothetical protein
VGVLHMKATAAKIAIALALIVSDGALAAVSTAVAIISLALGSSASRATGRTSINPAKISSLVRSLPRVGSTRRRSAGLPRCAAGLAMRWTSGCST